MQASAPRLAPLTIEFQNDPVAGDVPALGVLSSVACALPLRGLEPNMSERRRRCC